MYRSRPYPNGCVAVAPRCARLPPTSSNTWFAESATEWIASASIEDDEVSANAANLVAAIPRLAPSAATTALVPPSALTELPGSLRCAAFRRRFARQSRRRRAPLRSRSKCLLDLRDRRYRHRVEAVRHGEVQRREVGYRDQRRQPLQ